MSFENKLLASYGLDATESLISVAGDFLTVKTIGVTSVDAPVPRLADVDLTAHVVNISTIVGLVSTTFSHAENDSDRSDLTKDCGTTLLLTTGARVLIPLIQPETFAAVLQNAEESRVAQIKQANCNELWKSVMVGQIKQYDFEQVASFKTAAKIADKFVELYKER